MSIFRFCRHIPEFFRYVAWHILTIKSVTLLDIPVLPVYYEDYKTDLKGSTEEILDFLKLDFAKGQNLPYFNSNKDYSEYFTHEERVRASELMRRLVNARDSDGVGVKLLKRYWVDDDIVDGKTRMRGQPEQTKKKMVKKEKK